MRSIIIKTSFFTPYLYINYLHDTHLDTNGPKNKRIELTSHVIKTADGKDGDDNLVIQSRKIEQLNGSEYINRQRRYLSASLF